MSATLPGGPGRPGDPPPLTSSGPVLRRLEEVGPAAATLFRACAFLGPEDIPVWLFQGGVDELPVPLVWGSRARAEALAGLCRSSLARWTSPDGISVDPVLQAAGRELLGEERRGWAAGVVRLVAGAFPDDDGDVDDLATEPCRTRLVPHALAVASHEEAGESEPFATSWLLERVAAHEHRRGRVSGARRLLERALDVAEAGYGPGHPIVGRALAHLALLQQDMGELTVACRGFERALAICESAYGPDHPEVGAHLTNLAVALQDLGQLAGARACLERALRIAESVDRPDRPAMARILNNLGSVLGDLGAPAGARQCFERALAVGEAALGREHPVVLSIRANRAQLMRTPGAGA